MRKYIIYVMMALFLGIVTLNSTGPGSGETPEDMLVGEHRFGVQFIWDGYGSCTITKEEDGFKITGSQFSKDKEDYVLIKGTISIIDDRVFRVTGSLKTNIKDCCGKVEKQGAFTFRRWGKRRFWRVQNPERENLCDMHVCHYYIDIFMKSGKD